MRPVVPIAHLCRGASCVHFSCLFLHGVLTFTRLSLTPHSFFGEVANSNFLMMKLCACRESKTKQKMRENAIVEFCLLERSEFSHEWLLPVARGIPYLSASLLKPNISFSSSLSLSLAYFRSFIISDVTLHNTNRLDIVFRQQLHF